MTVYVIKVLAADERDFSFEDQFLPGELVSETDSGALCSSADIALTFHTREAAEAARGLLPRWVDVKVVKLVASPALEVVR